MDIGAGLAVKGGTMVYAVCSLLDRAGREQVDAFFRRNPGWTCDLPKDLPGRRHGEGVLMTPAHDGTDGFFFARMNKRSVEQLSELQSLLRTYNIVLRL